MAVKKLQVWIGGLCMYVPKHDKDAKLDRVYVLMPESGVDDVEPHIARLVTRDETIELEGLSLTLPPFGRKGAAKDSLPKTLFPVNEFSKRPIPRPYFDTPCHKRDLVARLVLEGGRCVRSAAEAQFDVAGTRLCLCHNLTWEIALETDDASFELQLIELATGDEARVVTVPIEANAARIEIHHVPPHHFPSHPHDSETRPGSRMPHFGAYYHFTPDHENKVIPVFLGKCPTAEGGMSILGGDPVTCGGSISVAEE